MKSSNTSFSVVAISIHWVTAALITALVVSGFMSGFSEDVATKAAALRFHLPIAGLVLLLTLARLIWWWRFDSKPPALEATPAWQQMIASLTHKLLYALILVLLASGIAMSVMSGLPDALFGDAPFPQLSELAPRAGHGIAARITVIAVLLHAGAAAYHHVFLKDRTLKRMWFGNT